MGVSCDPPDVAKTRDVRIVSVPTCATAILEDFRKRVGEPKPEDMLVPLTHNLLRKRFRQVFRKAHIKEWPHDACRHTFASFYYKATESMPRLMQQLGHSRPAMSLKHYISLTDESWENYFTMGCTQDQINNQMMFIVELATRRRTTTSKCVKRTWPGYCWTTTTPRCPPRNGQNYAGSPFRPKRAPYALLGRLPGFHPQNGSVRPNRSHRCPPSRPMDGPLKPKAVTARNSVGGMRKSRPWPPHLPTR